MGLPTYTRQLELQLRMEDDSPHIPTSWGRTRFYFLLIVSSFACSCWTCVVSKTITKRNRWMVGQPRAVYHGGVLGHTHVCGRFFKVLIVFMFCVSARRRLVGLVSL